MTNTQLFTLDITAMSPFRESNLVFDRPDGFLDTETEEYCQKSFERLLAAAADLRE